METHTQLGPISDLCVIDPEKSGQGQVVTCSGAYKDGSLRVVRNGIGINEHAGIDMPEIRYLFSIYDDVSCTRVKAILTSFSLATLAFAVSGEELENITNCGLILNEQTLLCNNITTATGNSVVQVTASGVRLVRASDLSVIDTLTLGFVKDLAGAIGKNIDSRLYNMLLF